MKALLLFFITCSSVMAEEQAILFLENSSIETSDELSVSSSSITYQNHRRNLLWSYPNEVVQATDLGFSFKKSSGDYQGEDLFFQRIDIRSAKKWNNSSLTGFHLGFSAFKYNSESQILNYELYHQQVDKNKQFQISINNGFLFEKLSVPGAMNSLLTYSDLKLNLLYLGLKNWRVPFQLLNTEISDGNKRQDFQGSILYGRSYPTWIWVGYTVQYLVNSEKKNYWSPETFLAHGIVLDTAKTFFDKYTVKLSVQKRIIQEEDFDSGNAESLFLSFEYGKRDKTLFGITSSSIKSEQASNEWTSKELKLYLNHSF